ncbi:MAG: ATP-binding protein [Candidatus Thorarchaeota archaeon]|nr:ATP-binding protein [Candidatus Thorarchaeota archaeon]
MNRQGGRRSKITLFTDFDGAFDGVLAKVIPVAATYTSEWAGSAARYDCRVKVRYDKELMAQLEEGMLLAVENFRSFSKKSVNSRIKRYTVMVVSKVWPLHYGLGGVSDNHYFPLQLEIIEQAVTDWSTDDQSTMMIQLDAIPINYDLILDEHGNIEFRKGFSYPLVGSKVQVIHSDLVNLIYNDRVKKAIGFDKDFTSPDPRKDPRVGVLRMFTESDEQIPIYVDIYKLVRYHFGVFSFTGGGKSNLVSNLIRRILYHTKDTKVVLFDISCEYPFLLSDVFMDSKIKSKIVLEEDPSDGARFAKSIVKPRDFEDNPAANGILEDIFRRGVVTYFNRPLTDVPTYNSIIEEARSMRTENMSKPTYVQAIDEIIDAVYDWMTRMNKRENDELDEQFVDHLHAEAQDAMAKFYVHEKSTLYAWGTTRDSLKSVIARSRTAASSGVTVKDMLKMLGGPERVLCISIADPDIIRELVIRLTEAALRQRKKSFEIRPQILFVFDEAQEFIPNNASGHLAHCSAAVERLLRQGRKYGLGGAVATQRIAYVNTNILQQLHTFFVGTLPRPYDRTVVSSSFQIDLSILDKTLEFPPGSWLLSSYIATGLDNVPVFVKADNAEDVLMLYLDHHKRQEEE